MLIHIGFAQAYVVSIIIAWYVFAIAQIINGNYADQDSKNTKIAQGIAVFILTCVCGSMILALWSGGFFAQVEP